MPETEWGWMISPQELDSWILYDDNELTLVNKPALVVCHPSKQGPWSSLAGAYREHTGAESAFLVSRLDRETSGIVIFAKQKLVSRAYQMALQERRVDKAYLAILEGELAAEALADGDIGPDKRSIVHCKSCVKTDGRRQSAQTRFTPLKSHGGYTLAKVEPITGRKHQIRVHAQHMGHSVVGDKLYGPDEGLFLDFIETGWTEALAAKLSHKRQALHAYRMTFRFPEGERSFRAPPATDFADFCERNLAISPEELAAFASE